MKALVLFCLLIICSVLNAQPGAEKLEKWSRDHLLAGLDELKEYLSIPNNGLYADHVEKNMVWTEKAFADRGFTTQRIETDGMPLLLANFKVRKPVKTVLVYLQVDGQPVDSAEWQQESPYLPVLKTSTDDDWQKIPWPKEPTDINYESRVFARSASDAKGPIVMFLKALDIMKEQKLSPNYNLKVIMDFEEELGSPHLPAAVEKNKELLAADMLIIFDGPMHITNRPTLTFGARGIATITLTTFGPRVPQHSGHYGNYAPNPALRMSQLLASMKDEKGRVTISGYYDGIVLDRATKEILKQVPDDEVFIKKKIGIARTDAIAATYQESIQYPSLNIRGMNSGWVGDAVRTIIPDKAVAEIDVRLVPESDAERLIGLIRDHIRSQGYHFVEGAPDEAERSEYDKLISFEYDVSYQAFRTAYDSETGLWLNKALKRAFGQEPIRIRMAGGSIPISPFVTTLGIPAVSVPTVNPDNNQHSPNENLRTGNFKDGIKTYLAVLTEAL